MYVLLGILPLPDVGWRPDSIRVYRYVLVVFVVSDWTRGVGVGDFFGGNSLFRGGDDKRWDRIHI